MISIEHHMKEDEIYIIDDDGNHMDLNIVLNDDGDVFLTQIRDDQTEMADVIHISQEMFSQIFIALQLPQGLYTAEAQEVVKQ